MPTLAQLLESFPETQGVEAPADEILAETTDANSLRPVPLGRMRRFGLLGTLHAKVAAAYLFYWIRGWFTSAAQRERLLAETHWKSAARVLDSMNYLRGAAMKVGQTLANFPDIAPKAFVDTLDQLHYDAPPMHWSLLAEMVRNELGDDPQNLFARFEQRAFAAASLGQVHRAELPTGEDVVLKIQYPGIARTIREDVRNLLLFLLPSRLSKDWENVKEQADDLRLRLELETDYEAEAATLTKVRSLFREDDGIVVPRVHTQFSTPRILTMDRVEGVHLDEFVARGPTQEQRNGVAKRLVRAWYRMMYAGRLLYLDFHPGNIMVFDDGRIGMLDFGMMLPLDDELWRLFHVIDRALTTGRREDRIAANEMWCGVDRDAWTTERVETTAAYADWCWRARYCGGEFDFGDEADFREGVDLFAKMASRRYTRAHPCTPVICRSQFGWRSILYRLRAKFDIRPIAESEIKATGWDRSEYLLAAGP